ARHSPGQGAPGGDVGQFQHQPGCLGRRQSGLAALGRALAPNLALAAAGDRLAASRGRRLGRTLPPTTWTKLDWIGHRDRCGRRAALSSSTLGPTPRGAPHLD
ncbi:MAG: hypothetical protein WCO84_09170, partial [bacterium]